MAREQNGEDDQHRDRADVNKYLHQPDELRAEQEEKRGETDKRDDQTKRGVDELGQCGGGERAGQRHDGDDDERRRCSFGETISARGKISSASRAARDSPR